MKLAAAGMFFFLALQDDGKVKRAITSRNEGDLKAAVSDLVRENSAAAAKSLLGNLGSVSPQDENLYWIVVRGAASFTSREALERIGEYAANRKGSATAADLAFALTSNLSESVGVALALILPTATEDVKTLCIEHALAVRAKDAIPGIVDALEAFLKKKDQVRAAKTTRVLRLLTQVDFADNAQGWRGWWESNKDKPLPPPGAKKASGGTGTVVETLDPGRDEEFEKVKGPIVVIKGVCKDNGHGRDHNYDHIEATLAKMNIPHTVISKEEFEAEAFKVEDKMVLLINCHYWKLHCKCTQCYQGPQSGQKTGPRSGTCPPHCPHDNADYKLSDRGIQKILSFVNKGGYLFTEDWQLEEILERAFGNIVQHGDYLKDQVVQVYPKAGETSHPYLRRIFAKAPKAAGSGTVSEAEFESVKHEWKIDADSPSIDVRSPDVRVLMVSPELEASNKGQGAVAITFRYSKGQVLHVLSHFGKQKKAEDEYALQNLMLNFILEASEKWNLARGPKKK